MTNRNKKPSSTAPPLSPAVKKLRSTSIWKRVYSEMSPSKGKVKGKNLSNYGKTGTRISQEKFLREVDKVAYLAIKLQKARGQNLMSVFDEFYTENIIKKRK